MFDCIKNGMRAIFRNRLRSVLTISGIFIGVSSVVIISSIGQIGQSTIDDELVKMGMDSVVISGQKSNSHGLSQNDIDSVKQISTVSNAMPLMHKMSCTEILQQKSECMLWGVNEDADNVIELHPIYGRLINRGDVASSSRVCLIDEEIARKRYKRSNIIGKTISVKVGNSFHDFEVVGIVQNGVNVLQNMLGEIIPEFVYIPHTTMSELSNQAFFDQIAVKVNSVQNSEGISDDLTRAINAQRLSEVELRVENLLKQKNQLNQIVDIITIVLSVIAGISLIVSGLSIMTVMLVSVNERTREIGIKKSIGARNMDIMKEFIIESILITLFGGVLGTVAGISIAAAGCIIFSFNFTINLAFVLQILLISMGIGLIFGVYPAYRASKLKPVDALRYE